MSGPASEGIMSLQLIPKPYRNKIWTWANDQIQLPGATNTTDLGIQTMHRTCRTSIGTGNLNSPGNQVVPIMRSTDALRSGSLDLCSAPPETSDLRQYVSFGSIRRDEQRLYYRWC